LKVRKRIVAALKKAWQVLKLGPFGRFSDEVMFAASKRPGRY